MLLRSKQLFLIQRCIVRCISDCTTTPKGGLGSMPTEPEPSLDISSLEKDSSFLERKHNKRSLKVAILGAPNAGKSTLINKIIGHPVFSVSKKVHTTRKRARAAVVRENVQILFVDTPGLVSASEVKRHHLEPCFVQDGLRAVKEAHIVGIVHDVGNPWNRWRLDSKILNILNGMEVHKKAFLILNKVDVIKNKEILLDLITKLSCSKKLDAEVEKLSLQSENHMTESEELPLKQSKVPQHGWPNFAEVFLVSALSGDGVPEVLEYLLKEAEEGKWALPPGRITDQKQHKILEELIRGRLLDALPKEVPYNLVIETEYFHINELGEIIAVVLVVCPLERHRKMLLTGNGRVVRRVATEAEADARDALQTHVRLRVQVTTRAEVQRSVTSQ